jgi:recombinational DNA repair protein (RecF pathway)
MKTCARCGKDVAADDQYMHNGQGLCEDCYMDALSPSKACDPWAVYTAKRNLDQKTPSLTPLQQQIIDLLEEKGPLAREELLKNLGIDDQTLQRTFATLRHMELARATKKGNRILYTLFDSRQDL